MVLILMISFEEEPIRPCKRVEVAQPPADGLSNSICSRSARGAGRALVLLFAGSEEPSSLLTQRASGGRRSY